MARVNVEQTAFTDARFNTLGRLIGSDRHAALGRMAMVWNHCQERGVYILTPDQLNDIHPDIPDFAVVVCASGLGIEGEGGIYLSGTKGRVEWLEKARVTGKNGGVLGGRPAAHKPLGVIAAETPGGLSSKTPPAPAPALKDEKKPLPMVGSKKSSRNLIEEFEPDTEQAAWAANAGIDPRTETENWRDHNRNNGYRTKTGPVQDPAASWRTWMRNAAKWSGEKRGSKPTEVKPRTEEPAPSPLADERKREILENLVPQVHRFIREAGDVDGRSDGIEDFGSYFADAFSSYSVADRWATYLRYCQQYGLQAKP